LGLTALDAAAKRKTAQSNSRCPAHSLITKLTELSGILTAFSKYFALK